MCVCVCERERERERARDAVGAVLSRAFSDTNSLSSGLQRGLATETLCGMLG